MGKPSSEIAMIYEAAIQAGSTTTMREVSARIAKGRHFVGEWLARVEEALAVGDLTTFANPTREKALCEEETRCLQVYDQLVDDWLEGAHFSIQPKARYFIQVMDKSGTWSGNSADSGQTTVPFMSLSGGKLEPPRGWPNDSAARSIQAQLPKAVWPCTWYLLEEIFAKADSLPDTHFSETVVSSMAERGAPGAVRVLIGLE
jgi:hypothetical protein